MARGKQHYKTCIEIEKRFEHKVFIEIYKIQTDRWLAVSTNKLICLT